MKVVPLTWKRSTLVIVVVVMSVLLITSYSYMQFDNESFSRSLLIQSIIISFIGVLVSRLPSLLQKYATFSDDYDAFKTKRSELMEGLNTLWEDQTLPPTDDDFHEMCLYLRDQGDIEIPVSDIKSIEIGSTNDPRVSIKVNGDHSGVTPHSLHKNMKRCTERWEKEINETEKAASVCITH